MAFDFSYENTTIQSSSGFKPAKKNAPIDVRTVVDSYSDIASIPNPYIGLTVTVKVDETNENKMTDYKVISLKANALGAANTLIDQVKRMNEYLEVSNNGNGNTSVDLSDYVTEEELNTKGYATTSYVDTEIANAVTGCTVDLSEYQKITDDTFKYYQ